MVWQVVCKAKVIESSSSSAYMALVKLSIGDIYTQQVGIRDSKVCIEGFMEAEYPLPKT